MGRAPCCDKANVKKGPWSPEEDAKLKSYIDQHGTGGNWIALPQKIGLKRCGKSCRLRWLNYLRPNIKHGGFSEEEDNLICNLYISIGSRWSIIAAQLPGRTDNDIKNYWNTRLKKKLLGKHHRKLTTAKHRRFKSSLSSSEAAAAANHNHDFNTLLINPLITPTTPNPNPNPQWAPIPYSNEEPHLNDHAAIRKLLLNLGGRFDHDHHHHHHHHSSSSSGEVVLETIQAVDHSLDHAAGSSTGGLDSGLEFLLSDADHHHQVTKIVDGDQMMMMTTCSDTMMTPHFDPSGLGSVVSLMLHHEYGFHQQQNDDGGTSTSTFPGGDQMMMRSYMEGSAAAGSI